MLVTEAGFSALISQIFKKSAKKWLSDRILLEVWNGIEHSRKDIFYRSGEFKP
jgi:hypothetical protein